MSENISIESRLQEGDYDCGQTCLNMLGYDGYSMFPNRQVCSFDLRSIEDAYILALLVGQEEMVDYSKPHIWSILGKGEVAGSMHWVIRYKDKVYCPTIGVHDVNEYKKKYVAYVLQVFYVPFVKKNSV